MGKVVIVVGAGPAGLAMAFQLRRRGQAYRVLERQRIGYSWSQHYDSLRLHTLKAVSALPGLPMPAEFPRFPHKDQVAAYLREYAAHFDLRVSEGVAVERAWRENGRWRLQTNHGQEEAEALVLATGIWSKPFCPNLPGRELFQGRMLHVNDYQNPQPFRGQRVLVVGAGNSGTEVAAELAAAGIETGIVVRSGVNFVPYPASAAAMRAAAWLFRHLPPAVSNWMLRQTRPDFGHLGLPRHPEPPVEAYPVVGFELPQAVEAGLVTVYAEIAELLPAGARFVDGREAAFEAIVLATGYRPAVDFVQPAPALDRHGRLLYPECFPNLFPVGYHYPATEGWLQAIGRVSDRAAARVAAALEG